MPSKRKLQPGLAAEAKERVQEDLTAPHLGSGRVAVYATPAMVALIERVSAELVDSSLPPDETSVGIHMEIDHLAPTARGDQVRVEVELVQIEGSRLVFEAEVHDSRELVGRARHVRAIIETERFLRRVQAKSKAENEG